MSAVSFADGANWNVALDYCKPSDRTTLLDVNPDNLYFGREIDKKVDYGVMNFKQSDGLTKDRKEYFLSGCLYTSNQEFAALSSWQLINYLKSTSDYECTARILFNYEELYSPTIFSNEKVFAVANQLANLASDYDGTHSAGIYGLINYLRAATYLEFYYKPDIEFSQNTWNMIKYATDSLSKNNHIYDLNTAAADILTEYIILLDLPGIRSEPHSIMVMKEIMHRMVVTKNWKNVPDIKLVSGYWNIFFIMFRGSGDAEYLNNIAQDSDFIELWGLVATDSEIKESAQLKDLYQSNAILEMARLAVKPQFSDLLCPYLAEVCELYDRLEVNWLRAIIAINQAGKCAEYNLCEDVDDLQDELVDYLFPNIFHYDDTELVFYTKLNRSGSDHLYYAIKQSQAQFFRLLGDESLVQGDVNTSLKCYVFESKTAYDDFAPYLFGISTNNGGMYIESRSEFYTWDRPSTYYLSLEELFRHEYVHYLQGRFLIPGYWGQTSLYANNRLTWYEEGNAELICTSTDDDGIKLKPSSYDRLKQEYPDCPSVEDVLNSYYGQNGSIFYPYGHLLWYHWYFDDFQLLRKFMDITISNDVQKFDDLVDSIVTNSGFEDRWRLFLAKVNNDMYEVWDIHTDWIRDDSITTKQLNIISDEFENSTGISNFTISQAKDSLISRFEILGSLTINQTVNNYSEAFVVANNYLDSLLKLLKSNESINNFHSIISYFTNLELVNNKAQISYKFVGSLRNSSVPESFAVDFQSSKQVALAESQIDFEAKCDGYIKEYNWEFEGGVPSVSSEMNPTVIYNNSGLYKVKLKIKGSSDTDTLSETKLQYIRIYEKPYLDNYCSATNGYDYSWIRSVMINDVENTSQGFVAPGYVDYTNTNIVELYRDSLNKLQVQVSYVNSNTIQIGAWIDLNQDGDFLDVGETIYSDFVPQNQQMEVLNFQIPESALTGSTRMRIRLNYKATPISPCGYDSYMGETEDYSVFIRDKSYINLSNINLTLNKGWNIISSNIEPIYKNMYVVWDDIKSNISLVKNGIGHTYIPAFEINQIGNWNIYDGYQIHLTEDASLAIEGFSIRPENTPLHLNQGWRLISYLRDNPLFVPTAFATIVNDNSLVLAKNSNGLTYIPQYGINQIGELLPGQGYQIYLSKNTILTYPPNSLEKKIINDNLKYPEPKHLIPIIINTGNNSVLVIESNDDDGEEIGVYTTDNILVGSGVFYNNKAVITIWGDNSTSQIKEGAYINEKLLLKKFSPENGILNDYEIKELIDGISGVAVTNLTYRNDAFIVAKAENQTQYNQLSEVTISPNPSKNDFVIELNISEEVDLEIKLFNANGGYINTLFDSKVNVGKFRKDFSSANISNGEYLLHIKMGNKNLIQKMIKLN